MLTKRSVPFTQMGVQNVRTTTVNIKTVVSRKQNSFLTNKKTRHASFEVTAFLAKK